jgi:hypothetical protein
LSSALAEGASSSISSSSVELFGPTSFPVEVTPDSAVVGAVLGAGTGVEGKLAPVVGGDGGLLSVDMTEAILAGTMVLVTSDESVPGLAAFLLKPFDKSLTGVEMDCRELDTLSSDTNGETFGVDFCIELDKISEAFAADDAPDETGGAVEETVGSMGYELVCVTGVGENAGG